MNELGQGLSLSGLGILITFSALGILIGLILLLKTLFPSRAGSAEREEPIAENSVFISSEREKLRKQAAAAGVGVLLKEQDRSAPGNLGKLLETPIGEWWKRGLDRIHGKE